MFAQYTHTACRGAGRSLYLTADHRETPAFQVTDEEDLPLILLENSRSSGRTAWSRTAAHSRNGPLQKGWLRTPGHSIDRFRLPSNWLLANSPNPLLDQPFMRTDFSRRAFPFSAQTVWNSLPQTVLISDSLSVLKSKLKLVCSIRLLLNTDPTCRQRLRSYDRIEI